MDGDSITLGFVFGLPPSVEMAAKYNNSPFYMDDTDDSYVILYNEDSSYDFHVSSLMVFKPEFKIHPAVEKRLRTAYQHSLTFEMRTRIAMTTAIERIRQTVDELGMSCDVEAYYFLFVHVTHHKDNGNKTLIRIEAQKAFNHIERVLLTLRRYAGHPIPGRKGYSLSLFDGPSSKSATFEDYEMK